MRTSIILSTYNGEGYIKEQLESILAQTVQPDEVMIRDDCSTDRTVDICKAFIDANSLWREWSITVNTTNMGWADNFLEGFKMAQNELIFPCDQDDIWLPEKIEKMMDVMNEHPEIGLLIGGHIKQIEDGKTSKREEKCSSDQLTKLVFDEKMIFVDYPGCVYCFRKSFYNQIQEYEFKGYPHDALLLRMGKLAGEAYYYDSPVIYWRRHLSNTTGTPVRNNLEWQKRIEYYVNCLVQMQKYCADYPGHGEEEKLIQENKDFYQLRLKAFRERKIFGKDSLFSCLRYIKYYPVPKSILGDVVRLIH